MQNPNNIVKGLDFGKQAKDKIFTGIDKLTQAVSSTLGASGKCVILEDFMGRPMMEFLSPLIESKRSRPPASI